MELGKLTAKLRDAVPVCLLVESKEIKRYKNIEIPDEIKKLEYQDFKFDVPLNGAITFKIMFEPGVLPETFPQAREHRPRKLLAQETQETQSASEPIADIAVAMADDVAIKTEIIEGESEGQLVFITAERETIEAIQEPAVAIGEAKAQTEDNKPAMKPAYKGKGKKNVAATKNEGK